MHPLLLKAGIGAATLAVGGGAALFSSASPAVAYSSPPVYLDISIGSTAQLVAKGAAVQVPVSTTCTTPYDQAYVSVTITERVSGKKTATGTQNYTVPCPGYRQTILVTVSSSNGVAFAKGTGYASGIIQSYYYYGEQETTNGTLTITS